MKIMVVARFIRLIFSVLLYCIYKIICKVLGHCCARSGDSKLSQEACFDCSISVLKKKKVETSSDFIIISSFKILIVLWFWHFLSRSYSCSLALVYIFCLFSIVNWFFFSFYLHFGQSLFLCFSFFSFCYSLPSSIYFSFCLSVSELFLLFLCHPLLCWKWRECQWAHSSRTTNMLFPWEWDLICFDLWIH